MSMRIAGVLRLLLAVAVLVAGVLWHPAKPAPEPLPALSEPTFSEQGEGCARLRGLDPVHLLIHLPPGPAGRVGVGYRDPASGRVMAPVRTILLPLQPGPLAVQWSETSRTATFLRDGNVTSLHFPEGRNVTRFAILNGDPVAVEGLICEGRTYLPLSFLAEGLALLADWRDPQAVILRPQE